MKLQLLLLFCVLQSICSFNIYEPFIYPPDVSSPYIVGGEMAPSGLAPFQCSVQQYRRHICGCAVINSQFVVTAGHCVHGESPTHIEILVGTNDLSNGTKYYAAERLIPHESFGTPHFAFDIAVIKVQQSIEFNEDIQPIELNDKEVPNGAEVQLTGWGRLSVGGTAPQKLYVVKLVTLQTEKCKIMGTNVHESHICTESPIGVGACHGDSGGPLVYGKKLVGVVNFGLPCAMGVPDAYAKVSYFVDWIKEHSSE